MNEIILIGAGGHARACIDVIELSGQYKIAGLVSKKGDISLDGIGYPIIGTDDDLPNLRKKYQYALVTVGQTKSAAIRVRLFNLIKKLEYNLPVVLSSRSHISPYSKIGAGTIIMHDVIVNTNVVIGQNCIINNKALIEHDAIVADHCHVATGAIVNGEVNVGKESFIGSGVVTKQSISIGNNCVIGAGAVLKTDVKSNQVIKK